MRQIISTAVVAVVVGAVAGATMGAVAQSGPDATAQQAVVPAVTSINAHKVDGRHAVSASASRKKRAGKLVATNKQGYLPNNIIKPAWKLIGGKPAGFADGVDDVGVARITLTTVTSPTSTTAHPGWNSDVLACPAGSKVTGGGVYSGNSKLHMTDSRPTGDGDSWTVWLDNTDSVAHYYSVYAVCMSTNPAGAIATASKGVKPAGLKKRRK